jgi:hypothetical protein
VHWRLCQPRAPCSANCFPLAAGASLNLGPQELGSEKGCGQQEKSNDRAVTLRNMGQL